MANLHVDIDSSMSVSRGLIVAIIFVLQLPPKESLRTVVISDSLYGMCTFSPRLFVEFDDDSFQEVETQVDVDSFFLKQVLDSSIFDSF